MTVHREEPDAPLIFRDGRWWQPLDVPGWVSLGFVREPRSRWATFRYHVLHGLLVGIPLPRVILWSWRHRGSFEDH